MPTKKHLAPYQVGILIFIVALIFVYWILSVVAPMIMLEVSYQYKKILRDEFAVSDIRGLVLPQFRFDFKVTDSKITSPDDLSFLHQVYNTETIVLQTCWPPGTTLQRLLVFARRLKN